MVRLWSGQPVGFDGKHFRVRETRFDPTPVQQPRIPIWVTGMWPHRAPLRRAARFDGVVPIALDEVGTPVCLEPDQLAEVVAWVRARRSDGGSFDVVVGAIGTEPERIAAFARAGATCYRPSAGVEGPGWQRPTLELIRRGPPAPRQSLG